MSEFLIILLTSLGLTTIVCACGIKCCYPHKINKVNDVNNIK